MQKNDMLAYIQSTLEDLPEDSLRELYWFIKMEVGA